MSSRLQTSTRVPGLCHPSEFVGLPDQASCRGCENVKAEVRNRWSRDTRPLQAGWCPLLAFSHNFTSLSHSGFTKTFRFWTNLIFIMLMTEDPYYGVPDDYMEQEEEWEREGLLDPAWEKQQRKVWIFCFKKTPQAPVINVTTITPGVQVHISFHSLCKDKRHKLY